MKDLFFHVSSSVPATCRAGEGKRPLAVSYQWDGKTKPVQEFLDSTKTTSLIVMKDGVVAHEAYLLAQRRRTGVFPWSMAKSFLSAIFGTVCQPGPYQEP